MKKVIILTFFLVTCLIQFVLAYEYDVVNLGAGEAFDINEYGQIVGVRPINGWSQSAFIWDVNGNGQSLGSLGGTYSLATSINNSGQVVGYSNLTGAGPFHAFRWSSDGIQDLGTLEGVPGGQNFRYAYGINDNGVIVGSVPTPYNQASMWDSNGSISVLGTLGGSTSDARSINESGQIAGFSRGSDNYDHAFVWDGEMHSIETAPSFAYDINDNKVVVGNSKIPGNLYAPTIWDVDSDSIIVLDTLAGVQSSMKANSINNLGFVVGRGANNAFLWDSNNGVRYLTELIDPASGWTLQNANSINDKGQIVGYGMYNGASRAFLLNPTAVTPEPISSALFLMGAGLLTGIKRFRKKV